MAEGKYADLSKEELIRLLEARERRARFGLVWEADEIERDKALNNDFVALDFVPELSVPRKLGGVKCFPTSSSRAITSTRCATSAWLSPGR
jgi:hypothetical protein